MKLRPMNPLSVPELEEEFKDFCTPSISKPETSDIFLKELDTILNLLRKFSLPEKHLHKANKKTYIQILKSLDELINLEVAQFLQKKPHLQVGNPAIIDRVKDLESIVQNVLTVFINVCFIATAKADNSMKTRLTMELQQRRVKIPRRSGTVNLSFKDKDVPNSLDTKLYAGYLSSLFVFSLKNINADIILVGKYRNKRSLLREHYERRLIDLFILMFDSDNSVSQFDNICRMSQRHPEEMRYLIQPLVLYKVRGQITEQSGHELEELVRVRLEKLGLKRGYDFNTSDTPIAGGGQGNRKKRNIDILIPYMTEDWPSSSKKLILQSQFSESDSGGIARRNTSQLEMITNLKKTYANSRFLELLDGAGYVYRLKADLKKIIDHPNVDSILQLRSIYVKLRRELQQIGFITPVEIGHAILRSDTGEIEIVRKNLYSEGYTKDEIDRALTFALKENYISKSNTKLAIVTAKSLAFARQLLIIDVIANFGRLFDGYLSNGDFFVIPGYGPRYGLDRENLAAKMEETIKLTTVGLTDYEKDITALLNDKVMRPIRYMD